MILVEILLVLAAVVAVYRLLRPVQRRLEQSIRGFLTRDRSGVIDAEAEDAGREDADKE